MGMDDAFNRLLERIEELVADNTRTNAALSEERSQRATLESENKRMKSYSEELRRHEQYVESTAERNADWVSFIAPKPTKPDDEMPF